MNSPNVPDPGTRPRPVLVMAAVLAALQWLAAGGQLAELLPARWAAMFSLAVGALGVGWAIIVQGNVTPLSSPRDRAGRPLAPIERRRPRPAPQPAPSTGGDPQ